MKKSLFLAIAALPLAFVACKSVDTVQRQIPESEPQQVYDQRINTDKSLAKNIAVLSVNEAQVSGDLLKVQVTLQNLKGSDQNLHYKFDWIRKDGMEQVAPANSWRIVTLKGGEIRSLSGIASSSEVVDFRLKLQED